MTSISRFTSSQLEQLSEAKQGKLDYLKAHLPAKSHPEASAAFAKVERALSEEIEEIKAELAKRK